MAAARRTPSASPSPVVPESFQSVDHFIEANALGDLPGRQLDAIRESAPAFREWFRAQGTCASVSTCHLIGLPYPRSFGLWRAALSPAPFVRISNRMMVVQFEERGNIRTLLVEPTEYELAARTPFFSSLDARVPGWLRSRVLDTGPTVEEHLRRLNIALSTIDYITFDHLHTQDLRRWLGTTQPQPDLEALGWSRRSEPVEPLFPNARLLVRRPEWEQLSSLHPMQRPWYQPSTFATLRSDKIVLLDSDVLLGPGVALVATPGHTPGNHTIVLNTGSGIWTQSENGIHAECYTPERSKIPGLARHARRYDQEVILNANTPDFTAIQYNNMVKEKLIADRGGPGGEWVQHFSSSELTPWNGAPGVSPSFTYGGISHGTLLAPGAVTGSAEPASIAARGAVTGSSDGSR